GQELDDVAELFGELDIGGLKLFDAFDGDVAFGHSNIKCQPGQDGELLSGVAAGDVEGWIGFGKTEALRFLESFGVAPAVAGHAREDGVAGAIDDSDEGVNSIGDQAAANSVNDRDPTAATGFKGNARVIFPGESKKIGAARGKQAFIGGDDGFSEA